MKKAKAMQDKSLRVAVKYCGGCNPWFDRRKMVKELEELLGIAIYPYDEAGPEPEVLLLVNGCTAACLSRPPLKAGRSLLIAGHTVEGMPVKGLLVEHLAALLAGKRLG